VSHNVMFFLADDNGELEASPVNAFESSMLSPEATSEQPLVPPPPPPLPPPVAMAAFELLVTEHLLDECVSSLLRDLFTGLLGKSLKLSVRCASGPMCLRPHFGALSQAVWFVPAPYALIPARGVSSAAWAHARE
jgi:hypothetical protein